MVTEEVEKTQDESPKRSRKRQKHESKKQERKKKRNSGMAYKTKEGKEVSKKKFSNANCNCRLKCVEKISEESRRNAFETFWKLGSFSCQNIFLCGLIKQMSPKLRRPKDGSRLQKSTSNQFYIQVDGSSVKVCKRYFLQTFQISDGRMTRAIKKLKIGDQPGSDKRGSGIPVNKISDERINVVRKHISSFPSYQSHYTRAENPNRKYLAPDLNVRLMYNLYREYCKEENILPVEEPIYRRSFNNDFNLHFHVPRKDTCLKCDMHKMKMSTLEDENEKKILEIQHELHLRKAEAARTSMKLDTEKSKNDKLFYAFTFDLQKALPFPILTTSVAYYKRNVYLYNLGCHELSTDLGFMYTWDETIASRGSQEISSCVTKHITARASTSRHVTMYSDTCTGQNRNWKFELRLIKLIQSSDNIDIIDHKFMVSGHSYLPNDSDFGSIESYARGKAIFVPADWRFMISKSRKKKAFHITEMSVQDFKSTQNLEQAITKRKKMSRMNRCHGSKCNGFV